jgi:hypothetical protein
MQTTAGAIVDCPFWSTKSRFPGDKGIRVELDKGKSVQGSVYVGPSRGIVIR